MRLRPLATLTVLTLAVPLALASAPAPAATPTVTVNRAPVVIAGGATGVTAARDVDTDASGRVYVLTPTSVRVFAASAKGNTAPTRTVPVTPPSGLDTARVAVSAAGWIYVLSSTADLTTSAITVVPPPTSGNATVTYSQTDLDLEQPLDLTAVGTEVAVIDNNRNTVEIYDLRAGDTTRTRYIAAGSATATRIFSPSTIDSDRAGRIVLSGPNWVAVFAAGVDSTDDTEATATAPQRFIQGARTGLGPDNGRVTTGVGLSATGAIVVGSADYYLVDDVSAATRNQRVVAFAPGADGDAAPTAILTGAKTGLGDYSGLELAPSGALVTNRYDLATASYVAAVSVHRPLGPYAAPGQVRGLTVKGKPSASKRPVSWKAVTSNADTPVTRYEFSYSCSGKGGGFGAGGSVGARSRSFTITFGTFKTGSCVVKVRAVNRVGTGKAAVVRFRVRR